MKKRIVALEKSATVGMESQKILSSAKDKIDRLTLLLNEANKELSASIGQSDEGGNERIVGKGLVANLNEYLDIDNLAIDKDMPGLVRYMMAYYFGDEFLATTTKTLISKSDKGGLLKCIIGNSI